MMYGRRPASIVKNVELFFCRYEHYHVAAPNSLGHLREAALGETAKRNLKRLNAFNSRERPSLRDRAASACEVFYRASRAVAREPAGHEMISPEPIDLSAAIS